MAPAVRVAIATGAVVVAAIVAIVVFATRDTDDGADGPQSSEPTSSAAGLPSTPPGTVREWDQARLLEGDLIEISFIGAPPGLGPCKSEYNAIGQADESGRAVVWLYEDFHRPPERVACPGGGMPGSVDLFVPPRTTDFEFVIDGATGRLVPLSS
jgi:hypothetical protein